MAIVAQTSNGYQFKRVRGWVQPVQTSMMLKDRVKTNQMRLDKLSDLKMQLEMIESEKLFLDTLGCLPKDKLKGFGMKHNPLMPFFIVVVLIRFFFRDYY